jgi:hypothetical protein
VATQKAVIPRGRKPCFVDLELQAGEGQLRIWIETKWASSLSGRDQLEKYASALTDERPTSGRKLLVLLAPAYRYRDFADAELPGLIRQRFMSWQDVYGVLSTWCKRNPKHNRRWFIEEVLDYMQAEGIQSPTRLTRGHASALRAYPTASAALEELFRGVSAAVGREWLHARGHRDEFKAKDLWGESSFSPNAKDGRRPPWPVYTRLAWIPRPIPVRSRRLSPPRSLRTTRGGDKGHL